MTPRKRRTRSNHGNVEPMARCRSAPELDFSAVVGGRDRECRNLPTARSASEISEIARFTSGVPTRSAKRRMTSPNFTPRQLARHFGLRRSMRRIRTMLMFERPQSSKGHLSNIQRVAQEVRNFSSFSLRAMATRSACRRQGKWNRKKSSRRNSGKSWDGLVFPSVGPNHSDLLFMLSGMRRSTPR